MDPKDSGRLRDLVRLDERYIRLIRDEKDSNAREQLRREHRIIIDEISTLETKYGKNAIELID